MSVPSLKHQKSKHVCVIFSNKLSSDILLNTVAQAAHQLCMPTPVLFNGVTEERTDPQIVSLLFHEGDERMAE